MNEKKEKKEKKDYKRGSTKILRELNKIKKTSQNIRRKTQKHRDKHTETERLLKKHSLQERNRPLYAPVHPESSIINC